MRALLAAFLLCALPLAAQAQTTQAQPPQAPAAGTPAPEAQAGADQTAPPDAGFLGKPEILRPQGPAKGFVVLFSGKEGFGAEEQSAAKTLQKHGAVVVEIDTKSYLDRLNAPSDDDCLYLVSDIELLSQQVQRADGSATYRTPAIAGIGAGGGLVLSIIQQTPAATIGQAVAVDPEPVSTAKQMCGLDKSPPEIGVESVAVSFTRAAGAPGKALVTQLTKQGADIDTDDSSDPPGKTLAGLLTDSLASTSKNDDPVAGLPLVELPAKQPSDTLAIVYSGDGGWRDIDKTVAEEFQARGVSTVGVDSLRYFWSQKSPGEVASDLAKIIDTYTRRWGAKHVLLVGYSFGADILPETYNLLPPPIRTKVRQISLLGFGTESSFEISVQGWLGGSTSSDRAVLPQVARIDPRLIQCVQGRDEDDSACQKLDASRAEIITLDGGHHFDGDYEALAGKILDGLKRRG